MRPCAFPFCLPANPRGGLTCTPGSESSVEWRQPSFPEMLGVCRELGVLPQPSGPLLWGRHTPNCTGNPMLLLWERGAHERWAQDLNLVLPFSALKSFLQTVLHLAHGELRLSRGTCLLPCWSRPLVGSHSCWPARPCLCEGPVRAGAPVPSRLPGQEEGPLIPGPGPGGVGLRDGARVSTPKILGGLLAWGRLTQAHSISPCCADLLVSTPNSFSLSLSPC